ncbi:MAG: mobile mystery protein B [Gemmatimonadota bacterium]
MFEAGPDGATPLDPDEIDDLLPAHIQTRDELNLWEQQNILEAAKWAERTRTAALQEPTIRTLHKRMFDDTWAWAGTYRRSNRNLGVDWPTIALEVKNLVGDGKFWLQNEAFSTDEAILRLHHRLVQIHPFPNGNGRHARLWADMLLTQNGRPTFEWRPGDLDQAGAAREAYIAGLQAADGGDYGPLIELFLEGRV